MTARICFVGLENLPVLAPEFERYGIGGEQVQQTLLAKAFVRRGIPVSMVVGDYGQPDGATWSGVQVYKAYRPREGIPVLRFVHPRWTKLWGALRRAAADVYYVSCAGAQIGQVAMWAARNDRRMIFRVASDADCEPGRLLIRFWRDRKLYEYGLRHAVSILAQSVRQQALMQSNYGLESSVAYMLVDAPERELSLAERDISLLWVGNIQRLKGPQVFLELARRIGSSTASMVGGPQRGAEDLYERVRAEAARSGTPTFHGALPYRAANRLFERARVFINTSDVEGFPNTFLQAWIRGVPVVSFFDPDDVIRREGLGHAAGSIDEMERAVRRLTGDPHAWLETSARCKAYMRRCYGEDQILAPYLSAFERAAIGRGKGLPEHRKLEAQWPKGNSQS
ncbi:MAG: glycosyltransferase family 4 protein [Gammaproteobacteria bacterium]|nr:glycosyltransferase family 4 protein [Gammaproteobacteria bacterium]